MITSMDPNQQVAPLSFTQLEKIDNMLTQHGEQIKKKNKQLYHILTALCDTTHTGGTLQKVEKMADKTQSQRKENIIEMPTNDDGRKSARHALMHTHKVELVALLKQYKAYERPHKPHARTLAAFKSQLGVHDDWENADFYTIALGEHITKQYEIRGKDKIFFAGQNDFLAFFHDIRWKTIPASIKAIRDELSTSMRIIKEKTKKGYTVRFLLDSSEETWDLQCTVTRDKQVYQRTYQLSYTDLKKMIDGLIGKDITYTHMLSPIKAKWSSSSLLNQEEDDDEEDEDED
jgi:hypothetical protein